MSLKSQKGFDLVGITVCVCSVLGKALFLLPVDKRNLDEYVLISYTAMLLNSAFNLPALVYFALRVTGNPDLKQNFAKTLLIFPVLFFSIFLLFLIVVSLIESYLLVELRLFSVAYAPFVGGLYYVYTQINQFVLT